MQHNWPKVVKAIRKIALNRTKIIGSHAADSSAFMLDLRVNMNETDRFHPFDTDGDLDRAISRMPDRCNYRSIKSYWAWKNGRIRIEDECLNVLDELEGLRTNFFEDSWNFAPGYRKPKEIIFTSHIEDDCEKLASLIINQCKK